MEQNELHLILNAATLPNPAALHLYFARALALPDWYGRNFDALYDVLTTLSSPTCLHLLHSAAPAMGPAWSTFLRVASDAAAGNPMLRILIQN